MSFRKLAYALSLLLTFAAVLPVAAQDIVPVVPTDHGDSVRGLVYARPFTLEQPYSYAYSKEQPRIQSGYILVLNVDPELAQPRNAWTPVIYVGRYPAEITNLRVESGRLVVLVPGEVDLAKDPAYFGSVELPERVDAARGAEELAAALKIGIRPFSSDVIASALAAGGPALRAVGINDVYRAVAGVLTTYVPEDRDRAEQYLKIPIGE
jgi:hypothetical protein